MNISKSKNNKFQATILWVVAAISLIVSLIAIFLLSVVNTSKLPSSCKQWSTSRNISAKCSTEIATLDQPQPAICYDGSNYTPCDTLANEQLDSKQQLVFSLAISVLAAALAIKISPRGN